MDRVQNKRRNWRVGMGLVVGTLAAVSIWRTWPRERLLTEVARPLVQADTMRTAICWLSSHQLLIVTTEKEASEEHDSSGTLVKEGWKGYADVLDTTTHTRSHLTALTDLFQRTTGPLEGQFAEGLHNIELSPDGSWLLWETTRTYGSDTISAYLTLHASHLDGTHYRDWEREKAEDEDQFFLDSHTLVQYKEDRGPINVRDLLDPRKDREYQKPEQEIACLERCAVQRHTFLVTGDSGRAGGLDAVKLGYFRTQDRVQFRYSEEPKPIQTWLVKFPITATDQRTFVSPKEKALFFDRVYWQPPLLLVWLHRLFPKYDPKLKWTEELSVSRIDGQGMHEIGQVPTQKDSYGTPQYALQDVRWLPDGKQVSFFYQGTLYVVPAEPEK